MTVIQLTSNTTCFTVMLTKTMIVDNVKPAAVSAYLYYDTRKSLIVNTKA